MFTLTLFDNNDQFYVSLSSGVPTIGRERYHFPSFEDAQLILKLMTPFLFKDQYLVIKHA